MKTCFDLIFIDFNDLKSEATPFLFNPSGKYGNLFFIYFQEVKISQVLPGYAPSYASDYVPSEVCNPSTKVTGCVSVCMYVLTEGSC